MKCKNNTCTNPVHKNDYWHGSASGWEREHGMTVKELLQKIAERVGPDAEVVYVFGDGDNDAGCYPVKDAFWASDSFDPVGCFMIQLDD